MYIFVSQLYLEPYPLVYMSCAVLHPLLETLHYEFQKASGMNGQ